MAFSRRTLLGALAKLAVVETLAGRRLPSS